MIRWRCRPFRTLVVDHAEGTLDDAQRRHLEQHLTECADCAGALAALRELPAQLHTSAVPEPGEDFWRRQRERIAHAIRELPLPQRGWNLAWLSDRSRMVPWRFGAAVAAALVAFGTYRLAHVPAPQPPRTTLKVAALDTEAVLALHDLMQAFVPADDYLPQVSLDDDTLRLALPLSDLLGVSLSPPLPGVTDLSGPELEGIDDLIGGAGRQAG